MLPKISMHSPSRIILLLFSVAIVTLSSCISYKKSLYFNNIPAGANADTMAVQLNTFTVPKIKPNDILNVSVQTLDPQNTSMMGTSTVNTFATQGSTGRTDASGFLVDGDGNIELPLVGKIKVGGLTTVEAREKITERAAKYYKEPVVNVRFVNFNITILGEVARPAVYTIANEKVSLLDAIGLAGDVTIYAKRDDILLIREENGVKRFVHFDLNSTDIFKSPYFYLQQGDYIIVDPIKNKIVSADATTNRNLAIISTFVTIVSVLVTVLYFAR